jgi:hypothetical protein
MTKSCIHLRARDYFVGYSIIPGSSPEGSDAFVYVFMNCRKKKSVGDRKGEADEGAKIFIISPTWFRLLGTSACSLMISLALAWPRLGSTKILQIIEMEIFLELGFLSLVYLELSLGVLPLKHFISVVTFAGILASSSHCVSCQSIVVKSNANHLSSVEEKDYQ